MNFITRLLGVVVLEKGARMSLRPLSRTRWEAMQPVLKRTLFSDPLSIIRADSEDYQDFLGTSVACEPNAR